MSPRRSSRARATQLPPAPPTHTNSSTSSISSSRAERNTRSKDKPSPSQHSNPPSQSVDDLDESTRPLRRTRSGADEIKEPKGNNREEEEEEDGEEEEVTRCICGQTEYPGLPSPTYDLLKQQAKEPGAAYALDAITDDLGGLFIQCDVCKVWQHGGCVNILDEASTPEEYFCEQCRRDLHKVATSPSGQKYSNYLPLKEEQSPPASPQLASRERSKRSADSKGTRAHEPTRRRATMNSREIYNEAEALRRAIEESKKETLPEGVGKKRSRSDSEERKDSSKRQRTGTKSNSPDADKALLSNSSSDEALATRLAVDHTPKKNIRGAAARNHQAKELRDQKERERQEAAAKRRSRVERRHGDESPGLDDPSNPPPPSNVSTPPTVDLPPPRSSHRKGASRNAQTSTTATSTTKSTRRVGRNQYTKDHLPPSSLSNTLDPNTTDPRNGSHHAAGMRTRSRSRSNARDLESPSGGGSASINGAGPGPGGGSANGLLGLGGGEISRPSRPKHMNPNRTSMNEMKKRVAAILEFVNRAEEEGRKRGNTVSSTSSSSAGGPSSSGSGNGSALTLVSSAGSDEGGSAPAPAVGTVSAEPEKEPGEKEPDFGALDAGEMLRILKARLVRWEGEYGGYGAAAANR